MKKNTKIIILILSIVVIVCVAVVLIFTGTAKGESEYDKRIAASEKYLDELNYEKAIAELEIAIEIEPNNAQGYIALAEVYEQMGDYESAIAVLEKAKEKVEDVSSVEILLDKLKESAYQSETELDNETGSEITVDENQNSENDEEGWTEIWSTGTYGDVLSEAYYNGDGILISHKEYGYDDDRNVIWYCVYEYNEYAEVVKWTRYTADNTCEEFGVNEYDKNHNLIKETYSDGNGNVTSFWTYEYDENGTKRKATYSMADGSFSNTNEYDENGNMIDN